MSEFDAAFDKLIDIEGGFSDHAADPGGATRYGITEVVARANGYQGDMRGLPLDVARAIYRAQYWELNRLDTVAAVAPAVAFELFDTGVNQGVAVAAQCLQRALNSLNRAQKDYPDLKVDGALGPVTVAALRAYIAARGMKGVLVLLRALNCLQGARYIEIAERHEVSESFIFGWFLHRVLIP